VNDSDELATYLDEAVSRALGNPPRAIATSTSDAGADAAGLGRRLAGRFAHNRTGHALRIVSGTSEHLRALRGDLEALSDAHHNTWATTQLLLARVNDLDGAVRHEIEHRIQAFQGAIASLELAAEELRVSVEQIEVSQRDLMDEIALEDDADDFYEEFEARFRGPEDEIERRLERWVDIVDRLPDRGTPILDVGCGRGEWLSLLSRHGIKAYGLDLNARFVAQCSDAGLEAVVANAFTYLEALPENSIGAVTAFHFVEHFTVPEVMHFLRLCFRAIRPGGAILLETPNPSNLRVAAFSFYLDPTHKRPIHPEFLKFAVERTGFGAIELHFANEAEDAPAIEAELELLPEGGAVRSLLEHTKWALFGPQDFAVVGVKPSA
jgi:O-antigen chain-terminating methyltransferase